MSQNRDVRGRVIRTVLWGAAPSEREAYRRIADHEDRAALLAVAPLDHEALARSLGVPVEALSASTLDLRDRLDRVSGWHARETGPSGTVGDYCTECGGRWPCETRQMADGTHPDSRTVNLLLGGEWVGEAVEPIDLGAVPYDPDTNQYAALFASGDLQIYKGAAGDGR